MSATADTPWADANWQTPPPPPPTQRTATAAHDTHPTGMHSCLLTEIIIFSVNLIISTKLSYACNLPGV